MESNKDINLFKKETRRKILLERSLMSQKEWEEKSQLIYEKVIAHPFFLYAEEIYCYLDYKNEAGTRRLIEESWRQGKKVAVPKIIRSEMYFFYINSFQELEDGYCHIMEPTTFVQAEGEDALVIMPGAAFDKNRNRIGYGKGFYDRYLSKHPSYHTLALAFELQFVDNIPVDVHDIRPETIITEENTYA